MEQWSFSIADMIVFIRSLGAVLLISLTSNCWWRCIRSIEGEGVGLSAWHLGSLEAQGPIHLSGIIAGVFLLLTGFLVCLGSSLLCIGSLVCPLGSLGCGIVPCLGVITGFQSQGSIAQTCLHSI